MDNLNQQDFLIVIRNCRTEFVLLILSEVFKPLED